MVQLRTCPGTLAPESRLLSKPEYWANGYTCDSCLPVHTVKTLFICSFRKGTFVQDLAKSQVPLCAGY